MADAIINNGGFLVSIVATVATTGGDKGKVTGFGTATVFDFCGVHKPTYKSQDASSSAGENIEITTGSGITVTAPKKTKKVSLVGASTTTTTVTDEYELVIMDASQDNLNLWRGYEKNGTALIILAGYGYDQDNVDHGFEALLCKVTEVSRGTAANGENALTIKVKGIQIAFASSVNAAAVNTKIASVGTSGVITPLGEDDVNLAASSREFTSDDVTELQAGRIVPKD